MKKIDLQTKIIIGLLLGIVVGFIFNAIGGKNNAILAGYIFPLFEFIGSLFIRLIRMCVVPLVFFSIAEGVANLGDVGKLKSIGITTILFILITGMISSGLGVLLGSIFKPGVGAQIVFDSAQEYQAVETPGFYDTILSFVAVNPFEAMANADMMPIITFAVFCGCAMLLSGEVGVSLRQGFSHLTTMMNKIIGIVLHMTPLGAFALIASTIGEFGSVLIGPMLKFFALDWTGQIIIEAVIFNIILIVICRVNPKNFWKCAVRPWIIAFTTGTSNAALPVSMNMAEKMGVPKSIYSFVIPIGTTANMNGICCFLGLLAVFTAQLNNIPLTANMLIYIAFESVVLAVGTAAVPMGGIVMATTLLTALGFPLDIVGIVAGSYKIVDGIHTSSNTVGNILLSVGTAACTKSLDRDKYKNLVLEDDDSVNNIKLQNS